MYKTRLVLLGLLVSFFAKAQNSLFITGGNSISGALCQNGQVFAWGLNRQPNVKSGYTKGTLGTGDTSSQNISVPTLVPFPKGVVITQLGPISGPYFLALDSTGKVWGWGSNVQGQLGTGDSLPRLSPTPVLVKKGSAVDVAGFRDPVSGQLCRIRKVYAGNATSLALTEDGRLLSWGNNVWYFGGVDTQGLLGNGGTANEPYPVFVMDGATHQPLSNVMDMAIGDHLAMALVRTNPKNATSGTVYTWGGGMSRTLGRNAQGTDNSGVESANSNVALPARFHSATDGPSQNGYLGNIQAIAAADVAGFALDVKGNVWGWGDGGYGSVLGPNVYTTSMPIRIAIVTRVPDTPAYIYDTLALPIKTIQVGQDFVVALTSDNKLISWGNNDCSRSSVGPAASPNYGCGGNLGNGGVASYSFPTTVEYAPGESHQDVIAIGRGDLWGYYVRSDNSVWTWGDNSVGQLGIGNYVTQNRAVRLALPCSLPNPQPLASIFPKDTGFCPKATGPITLHSGFQVGDSLADFYEFTWWRETDAATPDTVIVSKGTGKHAADLSISKPGTYGVTVRYVGPTASGEYYPSSSDQAKIDSLPAASCLLVGLETASSLQDLLTVSPNPSTQNFHIETKEPLSITVFDAMGQLVETLPSISSATIGNTWPKGIYMLAIQGKRDYRTLKLYKW